MRKVCVEIGLAAMVGLLLLAGCSKRSSKAAQEQDAYILAKNKQIDDERRSIQQAERKAHMKTADGYLKFQLQTDLEALDRELKALPANDPKKDKRDFYAQQLRDKNDAKRAAMNANFAEFDTLIEKVDNKEAFVQHLSELQMKLHKGGFSAEEARSLTQSFGDLAKFFFSKDKKQRWESLDKEGK